MRSIFFSRALASAGLLLALALPAGALCSAGSGVPADRLEAMARGVNLPGWTDTGTPRRTDEALLLELREAGLGHVRLPLGAERVMPAFSPPEVIAAQLAELDRALAMLTGLGFAVTVDMHPGGDFNALHRSDPEAAYRALEEGWRQAAVVVGAFPADHVFAELLNEPDVDFSVWDAQGRRLAATLRTLLPETTLVVGSAVYQRVDVLSSVEPIDDPNVVYAVHFYDPMAFTHQGQNWFPDDPLSRLRDVPFPADRSTPALAAEMARLKSAGDGEAVAALAEAYAEPWTAETIDRAFAEAGAWSRRHGAAVVLNEFGVLDFVAPPADRAHWLAAVARAAEAECMGWTHWDLEDGFGLVDPATGRLDPALLSALLGRQ